MEKIEGPNTKKSTHLLTKKEWNAPQVLTISPKIVQGKSIKSFVESTYTGKFGKYKYQDQANKRAGFC